MFISLITSVFNESINIFRIVIFKCARCIFIHSILQITEKLFIINNVTKLFGIPIESIYTTNSLEESVVLHALINIKICTRRCIKSSKQLINYDEQLHICRFIDKLFLYFFLKIFHLFLN